MVYGDEKTRDMSRSLLPSTRRQGARKHRAGLHRQARRTTRLEVARFERDPEAFDGAAGWEHEPDQGIRRMVADRREADKVNPFIRWATAVTRDLPWERRRSHIQSLLPKGVIGEHALFHLERAEAFRDPFKREHYQALRRLRARRYWMDRGELAELLRAVLGAPGGHRAFNGWLRARHVISYDKWGQPTSIAPTRMLQGAHDILPFLEEAEAHEPYSGSPTERYYYLRHRVLFDATQAFLRAFKKCRGDVEATLAALGMKGGRWRASDVSALPYVGA